MAQGYCCGSISVALPCKPRTKESINYEVANVTCPKRVGAQSLAYVTYVAYVETAYG